VTEVGPDLDAAGYGSEQLLPTSGREIARPRSRPDAGTFRHAIDRRRCGHVRVGGLGGGVVACNAVVDGGWRTGSCGAGVASGTTARRRSRPGPLRVATAGPSGAARASGASLSPQRNRLPPTSGEHQVGLELVTPAVRSGADDRGQGAVVGVCPCGRRELFSNCFTGPSVRAQRLTTGVSSRMASAVRRFHDRDLRRRDPARPLSHRRRYRVVRACSPP